MAQIHPEPEPDHDFRESLQKKLGSENEEFAGDASRNTAEEDEDRKYNKSIFATISRHRFFENTTMLVIVLNALWIGVDTEWNHSSLQGYTWKPEGVAWAINVTGFDPSPSVDADVVRQQRQHIRTLDDEHNTLKQVADLGYIDQDGPLPLEPYSIIVENMFCLYFSVELAFRFLAFARYRNCIFDGWFVFDSILVVCMVLETWLMPAIFLIISGDGGGSALAALSPFRLLRLLRLTRMARLMRFVPELLTLVKGMIRAATSVGFIFIFLLLVMYVFAILFTAQLEDRDNNPLTPNCDDNGEPDGCLGVGEFGETAPDLFATMGDSMLSLFTRGVLADNLAETVAAILASSLFLMWMFFIFLIITFATLLNMLIGVLCEVITEAASEEKVNVTVTSLKATIQDAFDQIDVNGDGIICEEEWKHIKQDAEVRQSLVSMGIETERMEERLDQMQEMLFAEPQEEDAAADQELGVSTGSNKLQKTMSQRSMPTPEERRELGFSVQELIDKVVDIRPDQNASALDLELLKSQVTKDQVRFKQRIKNIENGLKKILGPAAASVNLDTSSENPRGSLRPNTGHSQSEGGNKSTSGTNLQDVPTQVLFQALKNRTPPKPGSAYNHR
jgi:voltage-gated sodium channel